MRQTQHRRAHPSSLAPARALASQAFSRAAGAPLVAGNDVRLLRDAAENYPAWLESIRSAERTIHFESYIMHEDDVGREFAAALSAKAREGVKVRLVYDWLGGLGHASRGFWRSMSDAGVEVRCFNPPQFVSPFGWLTRDHRKMLAVDGSVAYVTGLCVGRRWVGDPERNVEPWRDTGVSLRGPAVADVEEAFAQVWAACGEPLPPGALPSRDSIPPAGDCNLRVIASVPNTAGLYRLDHLVASLARRALWLTDAYFVATTAYTQALVAAARDGVDVRLLVPGSSDVPLMRSLSRAGYRPLLEAGVRVYEWNGPMVHAKTAVADGLWARVGSTNLNIASWIGNYELDVAVEDKTFARRMGEMFLNDLEHSTEIVLSHRRRVRVAGLPEPPPPRGRRGRGARGSAGRAAVGALSFGNAVGAAITNHRLLGPAEAKLMAGGGLLLLFLTVVAVLWPRWVSVPLAVVGGWTSLALLLRAYKLHREGQTTDDAPPDPKALAPREDAPDAESHNVMSGILDNMPKRG